MGKSRSPFHVEAEAHVIVHPSRTRSQKTKLESSCAGRFDLDFESAGANLESGSVLRRLPIKSLRVDGFRDANLAYLARFQGVSCYSRSSPEQCTCNETRGLGSNSVLAAQLLGVQYGLYIQIEREIAL